MIYQHTDSVLGLYISLALLGLSAIDPIGIGIMPILLVQRNPYKRASVFLSGSFASLMVMGLLFAKGFGNAVLHFEQTNHWFVPLIEAIGGAILLLIATLVYMQLRTGKLSVEPSERVRGWLQLGNWQLFVIGALLVTVQSIVDVVFVIAMVRVGQFRLSNVQLVLAVATYSIAALVLQAAVIGAFRIAPERQKAKTLNTVHTLLVKYSNQALIFVSLGLGCLLFALAIRS